MRLCAWCFLLLALMLPLAAGAQDSIAQRLNTDRVGYLEPGTYVAADRIQFSLDALGANYLLRISGSPEIFVLYQDRASMGGRILKYDSGETALSVSGWGGLTLYVPSAPGGLPAERTGDSAMPAPYPVSLADVQSAAADEAQHLSYTHRLNVGFTANWNSLSDDPGARAFALDTMENTARGLDRFTASGAGREAIARRVDMVSLAEGPRPTITLNGRMLVVTFNPGRGYVGRASSRAIARALGTLFSIPQKPS
jgi:hypothetical protein